ncbi:hypothetical protein [Nocardia huaxiensis]|uniref:Uncharacterized protein n=1 Tax=Nocardia huaxiensis TaxID=2755382 RepID=A0A7D6Z7B9_9NOCA|nr:hypothetical protein [Nocardia huaxiensis]QLY28668.1 hypothetical protein H0264_25460 [Nocardia huaxiensis]UFS97859.1 hypothetical protein LPY97_08140 [Nocardia huaxiensis]
MRHGHCPKCSASTVYAAQNGLRLGEHPHAVLMPHTGPGFRGMVQGHNTTGLWQFVCTTCGYLETYVLDPAAIGFIQQRWTPVPQS